MDRRYGEAGRRPDILTPREVAAERRAAGRRDGMIITELGRLRMELKWAQKNKLIARAPGIECPWR